MFPLLASVNGASIDRSRYLGSSFQTRGTHSEYMESDSAIILFKRFPYRKWEHMAVLPALRGLRQKNRKFKAMVTTY